MATWEYRFLVHTPGLPPMLYRPGAPADQPEHGFDGTLEQALKELDEEMGYECFSISHGRDWRGNLSDIWYLRRKL